MFSQASMILFTRGGGLPQCMLGYTPLRADTSRGRAPLRQTPLGRHPTGQTHPPADTRPPTKATAADGTHPTGMHSCYDEVIRMLLLL